MAQPTINDVHTDGPLSDVSVAFMLNPAHFISGQVFPVVPVDSKTDTYYKWTRDQMYRDQMEKRPPGSETVGSGMEVATDSYRCDTFGLHKDLDDQTMSNADAQLNLPGTTALMLSQAAMIQKDNAWAAEYFTSGVWGTDVTGVTNFDQWSDGGSNPEEDVDTGRATILQNTGYEPNTLVVGYEVHRALKRHPAIRDAIKHVSKGPVTSELIAQYLEVDRYIVSKSTYNSAAENATATPVFTHGKHAMLCYSAPNPGLNVATAGYTFVWKGLTGLNDNGTKIKRFRMEEIESDRVEIVTAYDYKVVAPELGYMFNSAVA